MSTVSDLSDSNKVFRVNRLGKEVFSGGPAAFEEAIKAQRIRPDDLIYDQANNNWSFARNHPIFVRLSGEGFDDLKKTRRERKHRFPLGRMLASIIALSLCLYVLINYSKNIEFKQREATELEMMSDSRDHTTQASDAQKSEGEGEGAGEGSGAGSGEGGGAGEGGLGALAEDENRSPPSEGRDSLEMVFDLESEGLSEADVLAMTQYQSALTDEALLAQANRVYLRDPKGRQGLNMLLKVIGDVEFVIRRARARDGREHAEAKLTLTMINERFRARCEVMYGPRVCGLKVDHPTWPDAVVSSIARGEALLGMSREQAELAWGRPRKVNRLGARAERRLELCYEAGCERALTLERGVVTALKR